MRLQIEASSGYNSPMITLQIKDEIQSAVLSIYSKHLKTDDIVIEKPSQKKNGDFATNISFRIAAEVEENPHMVAEKLAKKLEQINYFSEVKSVGGFVNFYLNPEIYQKSLAEIIGKGAKYGQSDLFSGQKIQVEFISANPNGPLTLANGRGGYGGDVLANLYTWAGAQVDREYYVNDGGNQVAMLGRSLLYASTGQDTESEDIYRGDYITDVLGWYADDKKFDALLKNGNEFEIGYAAASDILEKLIKPSVAKMGVKYDRWFSEKEMTERGEVEEALEKFKKYGHTYEKDGALWMKTTDFSDDKDRVLIKSDGEKTYFANDVAYHYDKLYARKYDKIIDIWGPDHHGYIGRMMAAVEAMGCPGKLSIIITQIVRLIKDGQEYKMSKRAGTFVSMNDLFDLIGGPDASDVARYFFLSRSFNTHMDFDLNLAKDQTEKNPVFYVKYAYARIHGILDNAKGANSKAKADLKLLTKTEELELIDLMTQLPALVNSILTMDDYPIHHLLTYAHDLAKKFHVFYDKCRVIDEKNPELTAARLALTSATAQVLQIVGEKLIGISMLEKM